MDFSLETSVGFTVYRTALTLQLEMARRLKPFDLTPVQWSVLTRLAEQDGLPQKQVAETTFKDQPTTGRILDRLVEKGLVRRDGNPGDRRGFLIFLTEEGRCLRDRIVPVATQMNEDASNGLSFEERKTLLGLLAKVQGDFNR
ncbi:MarR family winged helix-turn-helix transcriptional regulator [Citrifermentans bremense]|uniref:MarR family winged helix-turn-helix transcriptional regulator n=1 Tax=Citrifermentans bremense TaxID=60035 RepID=UPI0004787342|nr:MarR family transcriptional regulator [Citrifermentans bremense]